MSKVSEQAKSGGKPILIKKVKTNDYYEREGY